MKKQGLLQNDGFQKVFFGSRRNFTGLRIMVLNMVNVFTACGKKIKVLPHVVKSTFTACGKNHKF